jgi:hypothetical protein
MIIVGKYLGKPSHGTQRSLWENNIKLDLGELIRGDMEWIEWTQDSCQHGGL